MAKGTDETREDDDDLSHCNFVDATFEPPLTTHWIGCDFPECGRWFHESCLGLKFSSDIERQRYAFVCKSHDNISGLDMFSDCVTVSVSDKSMQVEDEELILGSAAIKTARRSTYIPGTSSTEQLLPPNYMEYEGKFYHIANFRSLQQGEVYNPSTLRMARWMAVARNDFYEKVEAIVSPKKTTNGLYLNDISAFFVPGIGVKYGQVLGLLRKTSAKSAVPVFEWKKDNNIRDKVKACFKVLSHTKKGNGKWLLTETTDVMWSECNTHLVTFNGPLERRDCPLEVNAEALEALLPLLEKADEERLQKEETLKKHEAERKKMGLPEDMTVRLLKEVLDDLNITYRSNEKKADLIENVCRAGATLHDASHDHNMRGHAFFSFKFWITETPFEDWPPFRKNPLRLHYFEDRKENLLYLFYHVLFLLNAFGAYLEVIFLQQIVYFIIETFNVVLNQAGIMTILVQLLHVWMALVSLWLIAQVNFMTVLGEKINRMFSEET